MATRPWMRINQGASLGRKRITGLIGYGTIVGAQTPKPDDDHFVGVVLVPVEDASKFREDGEQRHPPLGARVVVTANRYGTIDSDRVSGGTRRSDGGVDVWLALELKPGEFNPA